MLIRPPSGEVGPLLRKGKDEASLPPAADEAAGQRNFTICAFLRDLPEEGACVFGPHSPADAFHGLVSPLDHAERATLCAFGFSDKRPDR